MRYLGTGIQDKEYSYFFDLDRFDIFSYYILFDSTAQFAELIGPADEGSVDFSYVSWDYTTEFMSSIQPTSEDLYIYLRTFDSIEDFTTDSTYDDLNYSAKTLLKRYIDKINYYNQRVTKHDYYDFGITSIYPFAELIVIKLKNQDSIVNAMLNKFVTKIVDSTSSIYTLNSESIMSRYLYHYSSSQSDYTSVYLKMIYNSLDYETINKENIVVSNLLYPVINSDSSKLYFDINIDSTSSNVDNKYEFYDLTENDILIVNNKYFCKVKNVVDNTTYSAPDYTFNVSYKIEFLELDTTDELNDYMDDEYTYYDFSVITYEYYFNLRSVKKINYGNEYQLDSSSLFSAVFSLKTFFGADNRANNEVLSSWTQFFSSLGNMSSITYSGAYDVTNNNKITLLSLYNSFFTDSFILPYDITIEKADITNQNTFTIDLFISTSTDITKFLGGYVRNGIYLFRESNISDTMLLRVDKMSQINPNTFSMKFVCLTYDEVWMNDITNSYYVIPSNSYLIQYKYHIYNIFPKIRLSNFSFSNDLNNLFTIHYWSYMEANDDSVL